MFICESIQHMDIFIKILDVNDDLVADKAIAGDPVAEKAIAGAPAAGNAIDDNWVTGYGGSRSGRVASI
jgi:hypothetical protein